MVYNMAATLLIALNLLDQKLYSNERIVAMFRKPGSMLWRCTLLVLIEFLTVGTGLTQDGNRKQLADVISKAGGELELSGEDCFVDLSGSGLTDELLKNLLETLEQCPTIRYLDLERTEITDSGFTSLAVLRNLLAVDVTNTTITDEGVKNFIGISLSAAVLVVDNSLQNSLAFPNWKNLRPRSRRGNYQYFDLRFSPSSTKLAIVAGDGVYLCTTEDAKLQSLPKQARFTDFSLDEKLMILTYLEGTSVLDLDTNEQIQFIPYQMTSPNRAALSSDQRFIIVDEYTAAFKFALDSRELMERLEAKVVGRSLLCTQRFPETVSNLITPDGTRVEGRINDTIRDVGMGVISGDGRRAGWVKKRFDHSVLSSAVHIADLKSGEVLNRIWTPDNHWTTGDFSGDGSRVVVGAFEGAVAVFDITTERLLFSHQSTAGAVKCVAISPDGNWLAAAFEHGSIRFWRIDANGADVSFAPPLRRKFRPSADAEMIFTTFVDSVQNSDNAKLDVVRRWRANLLSSTAELELLQLALRHPSNDVRLGILKLFATPGDPGYARVLFADAVMTQLFNIVDNLNEEVSVRREAVRTLLQSFEDSRKHLYERLAILKTDAYFTVPTLAEFIGDREVHHWKAGGAHDAPVGAVTLLGSWGMASSEAVPVLIEVLNEHPNQHTFAVAAADALGAMGNAAVQAIPALRRAINSGHGALKSAAKKAIATISSSN